MADETVILSSPGLIAWNSGEFGDPTFGGQALSIGLLQGTSTTTADANISVIGTGLNLTVNSVALDIGADPLVQGTQIDLIVTAVTAVTDVSTITQGSQINITQGEILFLFNDGWGSNSYGQFTWGITGDVAEVTGSQINLTVGNEVAFTDVNVSVQGQQLNTNITGVTTQADANVVEEGLQLNTQINNITVETNTPVNIQGSQINLTEGIKKTIEEFLKTVE